MKNLDFGLVFAQFAPDIEHVTAGVTVGGSLGEIDVLCAPVNFTLGSWGINPGTSENSKIQGCDRDDIMVKLDPIENNVKWDLYMNATDMVDGLGHSIPVDNITVNSTCMSGTGFSDLRSLGPDRQKICTGIPFNEWANSRNSLISV